MYYIHGWQIGELQNFSDSRLSIEESRVVVQEIHKGIGQSQLRKRFISGHVICSNCSENDEGQKLSHGLQGLIGESLSHPG